MINTQLRYTVNNSSADEVLHHLQKCDDVFVPVLSSRVVLQEYAKKIYDHAIRFEAWNDTELVGLIATYFNNETASGFITNVSVFREMSGQGIASSLMRKCLSYAYDEGYSSIELEVMRNNNAAIALYQKFFFKELRTKDGAVIMKCNIKESKQLL